MIRNWRLFALLAMLIGSGVGPLMAVAAADPTEIPDLLHKLEFPINPDVRRQAIHGLMDLKEKAAPAIPRLVRMTKSDDPELRKIAVAILGSIGPASKVAVADLRPRLKDTDMHVRYWTCQTFAAIGPEAKEVIPDLIVALRTDVASVRRHSALALGKISKEGNEQVVTSLIAALHDVSHQVRADGAQALGLLGNSATTAVAPLEKSLADPKFTAKVDAAIAHWRITGQTELVLKHLLAELQNVDHPWEASAGYALLGDAARSAVPTLQRLAETSEGELQLYAVEALGGIGKSSAPALVVLQKLADDEQSDEDLRDTAREAIEKIRR